MSIEQPDDDRFEQLLSVTPDADEVDDLDLAELPLDADPLDVADQHRPVPFDDESEL